LDNSYAVSGYPINAPTKNVARRQFSEATIDQSGDPADAVVDQRSKTRRGPLCPRRLRTPRRKRNLAVYGLHHVSQSRDGISR